MAVWTKKTQSEIELVLEPSKGVQDNSAEAVYSKMPEERKRKIDAYRQGFDISSTSSIMALGLEVSQPIREINRQVLSLPMSDVPELEKLFPELLLVFEQFDPTTLLESKRGLFAKFKNNRNVAAFITKFQSAESVILDIQTRLEQAGFQLEKDVATEEQLIQDNIRYIEDMQDFIFALHMTLEELLAEIKERESSVDLTDPVNYYVQNEVIEMKMAAENIDDQIHQLEQQLLLAKQTIPILLNLSQSNVKLIRQIRNIINTAIPAWENGFVVALHTKRQESAIKLGEATVDMTNRILVNNAKMLELNASAIAEAISQGVIKLETFKQANESILRTTKTLVEVRERSIRERKLQVDEYRKIAAELENVGQVDMTLLESSSETRNSRQAIMGGTRIDVGDTSLSKRFPSIKLKK